MQRNELNSERVEFSKRVYKLSETHSYYLAAAAIDGAGRIPFASKSAGTMR